MESSVANFLQPTSLTPKALPSLMEVHLVDKNDIFYKKGRVLAEDVYRQVWNTEQLIDGNDYAVVVCCNGSVVGNMNLQLRTEKKLLKSETFFGQEHWQEYYQNSSLRVSEASALALSEDLPREVRRPVMMMLIFGIQLLCRYERINVLVTVQHEFLMRILSKSLHLPFFCNESVKTTQGKVPMDNYWQRQDLPKIYYLEPNSNQTVDTCSSFFCYLHMSGLQTSFLPRIKTNPLTFSAFRKSCDGDEINCKF
jgi:hypothetical protein